MSSPARILGIYHHHWMAHAQKGLSEPYNLKTEFQAVGTISTA